jgi:hypothetical protein
VRRCLKYLKLSYKATSRTKKGQKVDLTHPFFLHKVPYGDDVISVDEASYVSCDTPRRGWSKIGSTIHKHPPKRRRVVSLLLAIDRTGVVAFEIKKGSFNQHIFSSFIKTLPIGKTVLLDNGFARPHQLTRESRAITRTDKFFLPLASARQARHNERHIKRLPDLAYSTALAMLDNSKLQIESCPIVI